MTVNEALIVCGILKKHGYGEHDITCEFGYSGISCYPDFEENKSINMEGCRNESGKWNSDMTLHPICEEIETALKKAGYEP